VTRHPVIKKLTYNILGLGFTPAIVILPAKPQFISPDDVKISMTFKFNLKSHFYSPILGE
jgi:hypothetical protein